MSEKILIVDDEKDILVMLRRHLELEGYNVFVAESGEEAMELMFKHFFNVVICDIRLPNCDGKDLLKKIRHLNLLCNVIMITGYSSMENVVFCLGDGATDYFTKPITDIDLLINTIKYTFQKIARWRRTLVYSPERHGGTGVK